MCTTLEAMRQRASFLQQRLRFYHLLARAHATEDRGGSLPGHSDYEQLLQRRLLRITFAIESHLVQHGCCQ